MRVLLGLIHKGACGGMVVPAFDHTLSVAELRRFVHSAVCMRCEQAVSDSDLEPEYAQVVEQ